MALEPEKFYEAANLKDNPFRSNPIHEYDPRMDTWVGYEKQKNQFVKFMTRTRADQVGNTNFIMIYGGFGTGKSHALLWGTNHVSKSNAAEFNSLAYFVPTLKKDKGKLTFAGAFKEDLVAKTSLVKDVKEFREFLKIQIVRYRQQEKIGSDITEEKLVEKIIPSVELYNFAREILGAENEEQIKDLLVPRGFNDYQAMTTFTRLVNLFVYEFKLDAGAERFKKAVFLMVDELDDLGRCTDKEANEVNDLLRHIYDNCPNCFGLIIALSAEVAELTAYFADYILSRINRHIVFELLDKDDAVTFVKEILDSNRISQGKDVEFFPFTEEAINAIASQLTEITPRKVVNVMQQVLEEVRLSGFDPQKNPIGLKELDDADIIEEILGDGGIG